MVKRFGSEIARLPKALWDAPVARAVAVMRDYDNDVNDTRINTYIPDGRWELGRWIGEFAGRQIPTDIVWPSSNLKGYKILILPHLKIVDKALVEKVTAFAQAGGVVVVGAQSGLKDRNCHIVEAVLPGLWRKVAGVEVEDWTMLDGKTRPVKLGGDRNFTLSLFAERLKPTRGTEVLATWDTDDTLLAGAPAITRAKVGKGSIIYVGGYCPSEATDTLADELMEMAGLSSLVDATPRVEAISRDSGKHKYLFLMNHSTKPEQVRGLPEKCKELLTAQKIAGGTLTLPAYGVAIVES